MDDAAGTTTRTSWVRQRSDLLAVLALILASFVFVGEQVSEHEMLSPIDEYQYVGYYAVVADEGVVRQGSKMPYYARKYMMCHGVRSVAGMEMNPAGCEKPNSVEYVIAGGTTADIYAPFYFLTTRVVAQPFIWAGVDFVDAGRMAGGFWLSLGAVFLFLTLRRARVPVTVALGLGLVLVGSLPAYWGTTYISTDATALASGSIAAWLTLRALDGKRSALVLFPLAATLATLFKLQNLIPFGAGAVVLVVTAAMAAGKAHPRLGAKVRSFVLDPRTIAAVVAIVASGIAQAAWLAIRSAIALGSAPALGVPIPLVFDNLLVETGNFFPALANGAMAPLSTGPESLPVYAVGTALAIGGAAGLAMSKGVAVRDRIFGLSTVLVTILAAPVLAVALSLVTGLYVPFPSRYGNSMFPWALICAGLLMNTQRRWARYVVLGLGAATWALALMFGEA